jgi:branched-chain amino acid transport system substrate-binding protein
VAKVMWAPGTTTDFAPYISQIPSTSGAVFAELSGATAIQFTQTYRKFGLKHPLIGGSVLTDQSIMPALGAAATGVTVASNYCEGSSDSNTQKFVAAFKKEYGIIPGSQAEGGYVKALLVLAAVKKLGGTAATHKNLLNALMTTPITTPQGPLAINKTYFAANENIYICRVESTAAGLENVPIKTYSNQPPLRKDQMESFAHDSAARPST